MRDFEPTSPFPPEPYRIRSVERIHLLPKPQRVEALERAGYNLFKVPARDVFIDLLTDSGTGSMSDRQWAALQCADESYAGSESFERFKAAVIDVMGFLEVIPTHQGRAAERVLFETLLKPGDVVLSNALFDTTRANVERVGGVGLDLPQKAALDPADESPLKGGIDLAALKRTLVTKGAAVRCVVLTCTANSLGGHPVSVANVEETSRLCRAHQVPLFIDAARFAENAGMLARRDPDCEGLAPSAIARRIFDAADGCLMSAKKNGLAHIGGLLAVRDQGLAERLRQNLVVTEGFETYGGLAGRDLDAIAVGLREALEPDVLEGRLAQVAALHGALVAADVPVVRPAGGHAVYIDAGALLPHLPADQFPGHAVACGLYLGGGIRSCEVGSLMFPERPPGGLELTRLAVPWRTYTGSHLGYVAATAGELAARRRELTGFKIVSAPSALRHFRAALSPSA